MTEPLEKTDPKINLRELVEELRGVTSEQTKLTAKQDSDIVRFRHVIIALGAMAALSWAIGTYYLGSIREEARAPVAGVTARVDKLELSSATQAASAKEDLRRLDDKVTGDLQRIRTEFLDGQRLMGGKLDRVDEKIDRLLVQPVPLVPRPATIRRGP